jgi:hypothetical protein
MTSCLPPLYARLAVYPIPSTPYLTPTLRYVRSVLTAEFRVSQVILERRHTEMYTTLIGARKQSVVDRLQIRRATRAVSTVELTTIILTTLTD